MADNGQLLGDDLIHWLSVEAQKRKLDPIAVAAVANAEGGFTGAVGDNGTSFGPFQLHIGGALPASVAAQGTDYAKTWANTPAGLTYALDRIQAVAAGQTGRQAVTSIVYGFERPKDPASEVTRAYATYQGITAGGGSSNSGGVGGAIVDAIKTGLGHGAIEIVTGNAPAGSAAGAADAVESVGKFLGRLADPNFWLRALQIVAGAVLVGGGVFLLAKQVGLAIARPQLGAAL